MKIAMFSNYLNHHQLPFCLEMQKQTKSNFYFVTEKPIATKRIGTYKIMDDGYDFLLKAYEEGNLEKAYKLADEADYVLIGHSNDSYIVNRLKQGKITFKCDERPFKEKIKYFNKIRSLRRIYLNHGKYQKYPLYMLCEGMYTATDFNEYGVYKNRMFKWGYFPETFKYDVDKLLKDKPNNKIRILWAGRLIDWKHPDVAVDLAEKLKEDCLDFEINIVGSGDMEDELKNMVTKRELSNCVKFLGVKPQETVREYMKESNIYLFTSDKQEGWGAVLNEAMNSCCACVASHMAGATGFMIENNVNGLVYKDGDLNDLHIKTKELICNNELRNKIGRNAYETIKNEWNAKVAADRLVALIKCLEKGEQSPFLSGPCSVAHPISEKDAYKSLTGNKYENS